MTNQSDLFPKMPKKPGQRKRDDLWGSPIHIANDEEMVPILRKLFGDEARHNARRQLAEMGLRMGKMDARYVHPLDIERIMAGSSSDAVHDAMAFEEAEAMFGPMDEYDY